MIMWLDDKFEPPYTEDVVWAPDCSAAVMAIITGWDINTIDLCDYMLDKDNGGNEMLLFIKWLEHEKVIQLYEYNIHFQTIGKEYTKEICEILNAHNCLVTFVTPPIDKLKPLDGPTKEPSPITEEPEILNQIYY